MSKTIFSAVVLAALACAALVSGCQTDKTEEHRLDNANMSPESRMALLPPEVRASIARDYPSARITKVVKENYKGGAEHWEVNLTTANGDTHKKEYDATGSEVPR